MSIFKLIILGDCSVGKTSLLQRYVNNNFTERYKATIGADFLNKHIIINAHIIIKKQIFKNIIIIFHIRLSLFSEIIIFSSL